MFAASSTHLVFFPQGVSLALAWTALAGGFAAAGQAATATNVPLRVVTPTTERQLEIWRGDRRLLLYTYGTNQYKPYIKELCTLRGENILLDAPSDHLHHHGIMYAIRVNGANFWEEAKEPGVEKPVSGIDWRTYASRRGLPQATFVQDLHWVATADRERADTLPVAALLEHRAITLCVDAEADEVAVRWRSEFQVGAGTPKATLSGASYHGLGLRLARPFDRVARHQNSENAPYSAQQTGDVTPARWTAVSHTIEGKDVSIAMFGHPANAGESRFFTMLNAFAYVSGTQNLENAPLEYTTGQKFTLDYLVLVYGRQPDRAFLEGRYRSWLEASKP